MMDTKHLRQNRRLVLGRSLLAGAAGMLPVPYVDDLLAGAVRSAMVRRLAEIRSVDVDANAVAQLATPRGSRLLTAASFGAVALGGARLAWRRIATSLLLVRRVDEAVQTFQLGTLFDHYCARHHVGFGLDGKRAELLRRSMDAAVRSARNEALETAFRRSLKRSGALAMRLPRGLSSLVGRLRKAPLSPEKVQSFEDRLETAESSGLVRRAVEAIEVEVVAVERTYVGALLEAFDRAWAPHRGPA
jgi:hypothetical protein